MSVRVLGEKVHDSILSNNCARFLHLTSIFEKFGASSVSGKVVVWNIFGKSSPNFYWILAAEAFYAVIDIMFESCIL